MTWSTQPRQDESRRQFIPYEIPLDPADPTPRGRARLVLPDDLTAEEAERLCEVIRSLAFPSHDTPDTKEQQ